MKTIAVVSASLSESSSTDQLGRKIAEEAVEALGGSERVEVEMISLRTLAHAIIDAMLAGYPSPDLEEAFEAVEHAHGVVAVTPAYNASMSGLFKSFFDVMPQEVMEGKPVLIGATGGTPRHSLVTEHAMRPMFTYLRAHVVPTAIFAATEDWGAHAKDSDTSGGLAIGLRTKRAAEELARIIAMNEGESVALTDDDAEAGSEVVAARADGRAGKAKTRSSDLAQASAQELTEMNPEDLYPDFTSFEDLLGDDR